MSGNILFVEPNNLNNSQGMNIPMDYSDYCIAVDLQVKTPRRDQCGQVDSNEVIYNLSWTSFMGGSSLTSSSEFDNMLTTSYTNSADDEEYAESVIREGLGISSVDIDFNNYFYPQVTIKFVDVRGVSLLHPQEIALRDKIQSGEDPLKMSGAIFQSLFMYPYPIFTLRVKGYYGKPVSLELSIIDFNAEFNSETGNFEITTQFLGYMFGPLQDIPMNFLIAAPFDEYYGRLFWEKKEFKFKDGTTIPTFINLIDSVKSLNKNLPQLASNSTEVREFKRLSEQNTALKQILSINDSFMNSFDSTKIIGDINTMFITTSSTTINYSRDLRLQLYDRIENYNKTYNGALVHPNGDVNGNKVYQPIKLFEKRNENFNGRSVEIVVKADAYETTLKESTWQDDVRLINGINDNTNKPSNSSLLSGCYVYVYENSNFSESLKDQITSNENDISILKGKLDEFQKAAAKETLGFLPTVENIFTITMAHFETLMELTYNCMKNIKNSNRKFKDLDLTIGQTDYYSNNESENKIFAPPFINYFTNDYSSSGNNRVLTWVGEIDKGSMEEVSLINGFLSGVTKTINKLDTIGGASLTSYNNYSSLPLSTSDLTINGNPYVDIYSGSSSTLKLDELMTHFALRLINFAKGVPSTEQSFKGEAAGKIEAINYYLAHGDLDSELLDKIENNNFNSNNFINFLLGIRDGVYIVENGKPIYKFANTNDKIGDIKTNSRVYGFGSAITTRDDIEYNWVVDGNKYLVPYNFSNIRDISQEINGISINKTNDYFYSCEDIFVDDKDYIDNANILIYDTPNTIKSKNEILLNDKNLTEIEVGKISDEWKYNLDTSYVDYYRDDVISSITLQVNKEEEIIVNVDAKDTEKGVLPTNTNTTNIPLFSTSQMLYPNGRYKGKNTTQNLVNKYITNEIIPSTLTIKQFDFGNGTIFGNPFYYTQNNNADTNVGLNCKGLLFLMTLPTFSNNGLWNPISISGSVKDIIKTITNGSAGVERVPKALLLAIGGLLWREEYYKTYNQDCFIYKDVTTDYVLRYRGEPASGNTYEYLPFSNDFLQNIDTPGGTLTNKLPSELFNLRQSIKNKFIKLFKDWIIDKNDGFNGIKINYELKVKLNGLSYELTGGDIYQLIKGWSVYDNKTNKIKVGKGVDRVTLSNNKELLLPETLWEYIKMYFSNNIYTVYDKIQINNNTNNNVINIFSSFILRNRETSKIVYNTLKLCLTDVTIVFCGIRNNNLITNNSNTLNININFLKWAFDSFKKQLLKLNTNNKVTNNTYEGESDKDNVSVKLNTYATFKRLYDRWLCSNTIDRWRVVDKDNMEQNFIFIDSFYNDIGNKLMINMGKLVDLIINLKYETNRENMNLYTFLAQICSDNNMQFMSLPIFNDWSNKKQLEEIFTPLPFNLSKGLNKGNTHVCLYTHEPSHNLDIPSTDSNLYGYKPDSFTLANANGDIVETNSVSMGGSESGNNKNVPVFGVTYGKQNQNFFDSVKVGMSNSQITGESLHNTQMIAQKFGEPNREITYAGQDLYAIYASRSYTCTVSMLGCMQIVPTMYFQLNNIPLFRGVYQIINVNHRINTSGMKTEFTGVRMSNAKIPFNTEIFNLNTLLDTDSELGATSLVDKIIINEINPQDFRLDMSEINRVSNYKTVPTYDGIKDYVVFESDNAEWGYNNLENHMKTLLNNIVMTIRENKCNFKISVSSMARNSNSGSDHDILNNNTNTRRMRMGLNKGCAMDLNGCTMDYEKGGSRDKQIQYSAELFNIIATKFTPYIRQLIWENSEYSTMGNNRVDNVIHISSYGYNLNDKTQIFETADLKTFSAVEVINKTTLQPLSPKFITTIKDMYKNKQIEKQNLLNVRNMTDEEFETAINNIIT